MTVYVSLLRGINVGPQKTVNMEELVARYESLDLENVRTYLRSGNVLFDSRDPDPEILAATLGEQISLALGFPVKVLIRTAADLRQITTSNPFLQGDARDPKTLHVTFLSDLPSAVLLDEVNAIKDDVDRFVIRGRDVYLSCPNGYGRTRFSNTFFEKKLGLVATTRNWKTVMALAAMANEGHAGESP
jgi:uncharacterized protein (DUF1697 family)